MTRIASALFFVIILCASSAFAQSGECAPAGSTSDTRGAADVEGQPVNVPALRFRLVGQNGQPVTSAVVDVRYQFQFMENPYTTHWSSWSEGQDVVQCKVNGSELEVPARTVVPQGWWIGGTEMSSRPRFDAVVVEFRLPDNCASRLKIRPDDFSRYAGSPLTVTLPCRGQARVAFK